MRNLLLVMLTVSIGTPLACGYEILPGCGVAKNMAKCDGCTDTPDDCHCDNQSKCVTAHRVCDEIFRAWERRDLGWVVFKRATTCYKRHQCNNDSGQDGGSCAGSGNCTTSEEWAYEDPTAWEYYEMWPCGPV